MVAKKYCKKGNYKHDTLFYILEDDTSILQWLSQKKFYNESRLDLN